MRSFIFLFCAVCCLSRSVAQTIVYDNSTSSLNNSQPLLPSWLNNSAEMGDEIWLANGPRQITDLKLMMSYNGTEAGTMDARIRFRYMDEFTQRPAEAFYTSNLFSSINILTGLNEYHFAIPQIVVPDHFLWTIEAYNRQGAAGQIGLAYFNPATVGFSDDFFWQSDAGSEWINYSWGGDPYANFGATLTAVPEPASIVAMLGGIALFRRRRK
ncbi:MAG: PEP-CTERM sorting domain-containing protein [Fimbriimonadaceae bacterium]